MSRTRAVSPRAFGRDPLSILDSVTRETGIARLEVGRRRVLAVATPDAAREALLSRQRELVKQNVVEAGSSGEVRRKEGLLAANDPADHLAARRALQPVFASRRIDGLAGVADEEATLAADAPRDGEIVAVEGLLATAAARIAVRALFESDPGDVRVLTADLRTVLVQFRLVTTRVTPFVALARVREGSAFLRAHDRLRTGLRTLASGSELGRALEGVRDGVGDETLGSELLGILLAAVETTATALTWALLELAERPDLHRQVADGHGVPARVFAETLRLYPPAWYVGRIALEPTTVGGEEVAPGDMVLVVPYLIHRSAEHHRDPLRFEPERWRDDDGEARRAFTFLPFGGGVRQCIGERLAWLEADALLAALARRWRFERVDAAPVDAVPGASLRPGRPVFLRVRARGGGAA